MNFADLIKFNPFRPGSLVSTGMFSGRYDELLILERMLVQAKNGNPSHFIVTGERGIGKSSLLFFLGITAVGEIPGIAGTTYKFVVVHIELEKDFEQIDILTRIGTQLRNEIARTFNVVEFAKGAWQFLSRWEVLGVKYDGPEKADLKPFEILDELVVTLEKVSLKLIEQGHDGILIMIDEADKPGAGAHLGQIIKNISEKLSKRGVQNVFFGLAGLPELVADLRESHESAPRIFHPLMLKPLEPKDRKEVVRKGLKEAEKKSGVEVKITPDAEEMISELSEGYPNFIQQFAYCAFEADRDNVIDLDDVHEGAHASAGAIDQLGSKYFADLFFDQIYSDDYRTVLKAMAQRGDEYVTKKELKVATGLKETTLSNAINVLKDKKIIRPKEGVMGVYRLPTKSFAVWIRSLTKAAPSA